MGGRVVRRHTPAAGPGFYAAPPSCTPSTPDSYLDKAPARRNLLGQHPQHQLLDVVQRDGGVFACQLHPSAGSGAVDVHKPRLFCLFRLARGAQRGGGAPAGPRPLLRSKVAGVHKVWCPAKRPDWCHASDHARHTLRAGMIDPLGARGQLRTWASCGKRCHCRPAAGQHPTPRKSPLRMHAA